MHALERSGLATELYVPTAKAHEEEWPVLARRLAAAPLASGRDCR